MTTPRLVVAALLALGAPALGTPYWIAWEGSDWPENQGWERVWGNWDGGHQGPGACRTLQDGVLTYDSLYDDGVYDFSEIWRPGQIDPDRGELFVMEWRLLVEQVTSWRADPVVGVSSDEAWRLGFQFGEDCIYSVFESHLAIPVGPGLFHDYRVVSSDMRTYTLYVDGAVAREGALAHLVAASELGWGDGVQGAASLHRWDYFRAGVIPEPDTVLAWAVVAACRVRTRAPRPGLSRRAPT